MPTRRRISDFDAALADHERRDEARHAEIMRYVGASEEFQKTSTRNTEVMFQGIADLTKLIGSTRETVAEENGKSQSNQLWIQGLLLLGAAVLGSGVMAWLESSFHLIH